jgi:ribosomal protein L37AE/L43A
MPMDKSERRVLYINRKDQGYCPRCGKKRRKGSKFTYCEDCREFFRSYNEKNSKSVNKVRKTRYNQRIKNKQCPRCGKSLGKKYKNKICAKCLEKQYNYNYRKKRAKK